MDLKQISETYWDMLRDYQRDAVISIRENLKQGSCNQVVVAPTGAGKTIIIMMIIILAMLKGKRVLFIAHREELIKQAWLKAVDAGISKMCAIIMANHPNEDYHKQVLFASINTISRYKRLMTVKHHNEFDLIIVDEGHRGIAPSYNAVYDAFPLANILLFTATPQLTDGRGLGVLCDKLVVVTNTYDLIQRGILKQFTIVRPNVPITDLKSKGNEYDMGDFEKKYGKSIFADVVPTWKKYGKGRTTIVACSSVKMADDLAAEFKANGVKAASLKSVRGKDKTPDADREKIIADLNSGDLEVCTFFGILVEGVDIPRISCVILATPTKSLIKYLQIIGRGLREYNNMNLVILDLVGASLVHGDPDLIREWSLEGRKKKKSDRESVDGDGLDDGKAPTVRRDLMVDESYSLIEITPEQRKQIVESDIDMLKRIAKEKGHNWRWSIHELARKIAKKEGITKQEAEKIIYQSAPSLKPPSFIKRKQYGKNTAN